MGHIGTCRFCKELGDDIIAHDYRPMVKYGVRHYAHWTCFVERFGFAGLERLSAWQVSRMPHVLLGRFSREERSAIEARVEQDRKQTEEYLSKRRRMGG